MLDTRSRDFAAATRDALVIDSIVVASGNALLNRRYTRTLSKASCMTEHKRGCWVVSVTLVVPGTNIRSVSTGHVAGCRLGTLAIMLGTTLGTTLGATLG